MSVTIVDVIRHGEPEGGSVLRGRTDHPLTERGIRQFQQRVERISQGQASWQRIYSSPLMRCQQSAQWLADHYRLPLIIEPQLVELDFGDWENKPLAELAANESDMAKLWQDPLNFCAPNGESVQALQQRILQQWQQHLAQHQGQQILWVCHGGVMRVLAQRLLQLTPEGMNRLAIPYAAWLRFRVQHTEHQGQAQQWVSLEQMDGSEIL